MLTKAQIKHIQSLAHKKERHEHQHFVIEGRKLIDEMLAETLRPRYFLQAERFANKRPNEYDAQIVPDFVFDKMSVQKNPEGILAVLPISAAALPELDKGFHLVLDRIQDPGNMGTILRTAEWYGLKQIICSPDCVDVYNPKCIQSSMGSVLRMQMAYKPLETLLSKTTLPIISSTLDGDKPSEVPANEDVMLIIGSESHGISPSLQALSSKQIQIPKQGGKAESLNAAVACGILLNHFLGH